MSHPVIRRDAGIDIAKFVLSLIVVSIHTYLFKDVSGKIYMMWNDLITGAAVPIFFVISGFYSGIALLDDNNCKSKISHTLKHIAKLYATWGGGMQYITPGYSCTSVNL